MHFFIATTALQEFWDSDTDIIGLGEWCHPKKSDILSNTIPFIWDKAVKIDDAAIYCWQIYDIVLNDLVGRFNKHHNLQQSKRYWEVIIGNWLYTFIQVIYDRLLTIEDLIRTYPSFETILLSEESFSIPLDYNDFISKVSEDLYNLQLYSQILSYKGFSFVRKDYPSEQNLTYRQQCNKRKNYFYRILRLFSKKAGITVTSPYFTGGMKSYFQLWKASKRQIVFDDFDDSFSFEFTISSNRGALFKDNLPGQDPFLTLLYSLLDTHIPILFLEGFQPFREFVLQKKTYPSQLYATANAAHSNFLFKFWIAENLPSIRFISIQHGGGYGIEKVSSPEIYERNISDKMLTWGWRESDNTLPSTHEKINHAINPNRKGGILFVSTGLPRYIYRLQTKYNSSLYKTVYIPKTIAFFKYAGGVDRFIFRPYPYEYGFRMTEKIQTYFPSLRIDDRQKTLYQQMARSRILVTDHIDTIVLETLAMNFPTIVFIEEVNHSFRDPSIVQWLVEAKILFFNEEEAAAHLNAVYGNVSEWWNSATVQVAREHFCKKYARTSSNWANEWVDIFNRLLES